MPQSLAEISALLERTPRILDALLRGLPDTLTLANEGGDTWTPVGIIAHYIETERQNWIARAVLIMEASQPPAFATMGRTPENDGTRSKSLPELLDTFAALRIESLTRLEAFNLTSSDLDRTGIHPAFGPVTLGNLLATWAAHDLTHLHQLSRTLAHQFRAQVGPWTAYLGVMHCTAHSS